MAPAQKFLSKRRQIDDVDDGTDDDADGTNDDADDTNDYNDDDTGDDTDDDDNDIVVNADVDISQRNKVFCCPPPLKKDSLIRFLSDRISFKSLTDQPPKDKS